MLPLSLSPTAICLLIYSFRVFAYVCAYVCLSMCVCAYGGQRNNLWCDFPSDVIHHGFSVCFFILVLDKRSRWSGAHQSCWPPSEHKAPSRLLFPRVGVTCIHTTPASLHPFWEWNLGLPTNTASTSLTEVISQPTSGNSYLPMFLTSDTSNNFITFIDLYNEPSFGSILFLFQFLFHWALITLLFTLGLTETFILLRYKQRATKSPCSECFTVHSIAANVSLLLKRRWTLFESGLLRK